MPRVSRHRSHRSRKHSRDPSDSEEEDSPRDRRSREDESSARVSRDPEPEKRKSSHAHERREALVVSNSDASAEHGKKRKERMEDVVVDVDRWIGDEDDDHKKLKADNSSLVDADAKSSKSSRKHEDSSETNDERTGKVEPGKRKLEKDSSLRESSRGQYKDEKERDRERRSESEQHRDSKKKDRELVSESGRYKDGKERERERGSESGHGKDMKERERERVIESGQYKDDRGSDRERRKGNDQYKDLRERDREQGIDGHQHRDVGERDRVRGSDKDKERGSRRDRERASGRDKERNLEREKGQGSEREKERGYEKDRDRDRVARDASRERGDVSLGRKYGIKVGSTEEGHTTRKDRKLNETQAQDVVPIPDLEKRSERQIRRRDKSEGKDKWMIDSRDGDDKKLSSKDDRTKISRQRDERHDDAKTRDKYMDDFDRDHDDRSARDLSAYKPDNKHYGDESKTLDGRYKRSRLQDNNLDGSSYVDDYEIRPEDSMVKKRYCDENEVCNELNYRGVKGPNEDIEKNVNGLSDKSRPEYRHSDKFDSSSRVNGPKSSAGSSAYRDSKVVEYEQRESSEERIRLVAASAVRSSALVVHSRVSVTRSDRIKSKVDGNSSEFYGEFVAPLNYERTSRPDHHTSPSKRKERSPSYSSDWQFSERSGYRRNLDVEQGKRTNNFKVEGRGLLVSEKPNANEVSQNPINNRESTPIVPLSINRTDYVSVNSPNHLPLGPLMRPGLDSPSVMGMHDDDNRYQVGDRKSYFRHKRSGDLGYGRGHANAWKAAPTWPSPISNGFLPVQHGPPPVYHPGVPQFPPLFGVRPSMDLGPGGVSFHMPEVAENFPGHGRPFGWHNAVDQPGPPHMQAWDGRNGVFGDDSLSFNRPDWDQSRHLLGTRGWEMSADLWKGQNGNISVDIAVAKKEIEGLTSKHPLMDEAQITRPGHELHNKRPRSESLLTESNEAKLSDSLSPNIAGNYLKPLTKKASEASNVAHDTIIKYQASYLSRINISPALANSELYEKCVLILKKSQNIGASTFVANVHPQSVEDERPVKKKSTSQFSNSPFPTANDSIFQKAMALYKKQNEISNVKLPVSALASGEENKLAPEASEAFDDEQRVQEMGETASTEEAAPPLVNAISDVSILAEDGKSNETADTGCAGCHDNKISDPVICASDSQAFEFLMEDCMVNSCRIPNSPQSTH